MGIVGKTGEGEWRGNVSRHHAVEPVDVLSPILGAPVYADDLLYGMVQRSFQLSVFSASALQPNLPA